MTDRIARLGTKHGFARRFVAGETLDEALRAIRPLSDRRQPVILNHLGENVDTPEEARRACQSYVRMLHALDDAHIDGNIAVKLTQLGLDFDAELCLSLASEIAAGAAHMRKTIEIDMEGSVYTEKTLQMFEHVQKAYGNAGVAIQAYLRRSEADLIRLAPIKPKVRIVKGAYLEPESIAFQKKTEVDANYRKLLDVMCEQIASSRDHGAQVAIGTHDPDLVDYATRQIRRLGLARQQYEFQMLLGIRRDLQQQVVSEGHPFRIYVPFGEAWVPYFMRRLSERPANLFFVVRSLVAEQGKPDSK